MDIKSPQKLTFAMMDLDSTDVTLFTITKWQLDHFSHFCTANATFSLYVKLRHPFPP